MGLNEMSKEGEGVNNVLLLVLRGAKEENDKISLLALEEVGPIEALGVQNSLNEVESNREDSLEVMIISKDLWKFNFHSKIL